MFKKQISMKKLYEKCKPGMLKKFGRVFSYDEFIYYLSKADTVQRNGCADPLQQEKA